MFTTETYIKLENNVTKLMLEDILKNQKQFDRNQPLNFDFSKVNFIDINALIFALELMRYLFRRGFKIELSLPKEESVRNYLERMAFINLVSDFVLIRTNRNILENYKGINTFQNSPFLSITRIEKSSDIHNILSAVRDRLENLMKRELLYDHQNVERFLVAISEVCQNVVEHSEDSGFIAVERYNNRNYETVKIAVSDGGIGIDGSLKNKKNISLPEKLRCVFFEGLSRYDDLGRGHGIPQLRKLTKMWKGFIRIRSDYASITGSYRNSAEKEYITTNLSKFAGVQVDIELPEKSLWKF